MNLHLFKSSKEPDMFGFTADPAGRNLPTEFGPWQKYGDVLPIGTSEGIAGIGTSEIVTRMVERNGFYVARSETTVTHDTQPRFPT